MWCLLCLMANLMLYDVYCYRRMRVTFLWMVLPQVD